MPVYSGLENSKERQRAHREVPLGEIPIIALFAHPVLTVGASAVHFTSNRRRLALVTGIAVLYATKCASNHYQVSHTARI